MTTLYKPSKTVTRLWKINVQDNLVTIQHGISNGVLQTDEIRFKTPEDALKDQESRINHKILRDGYSLDPNCEPPGLPMLLHNFRDHGHKLPQEVRVQAKLDGYRCIGSKYTMMSRKKEIITSMPHIKAELAQLHESITLDGEIYCHGASLQTHGSYIRSHEPQFGHLDFKYVVFDIQNDLKYYERRRLLENVILEHDFKHIEINPEFPGFRTGVKDYVVKFREAGYEGAIIRDPNGLYCCDTRSYSVQKAKAILKATFPVELITAADRGREQGLSIVVCRGHNGKKFRARMAMDESTRRMIFKDRKNITEAAADIEFSDYSEDGTPQHPRCIQFYKGWNLAEATEVQTII